VNPRDADPVASPNALEPWVDMLQDADVTSRQVGASALADHPSEDARDALTTALKDPDLSVRFDALRALVALGGDDVVRLLRGALQDAVPYYRQRAVRMLGEIGSEEALDAARSALGDSDASVRGEAERTIARVGSEKDVVHSDQVAAAAGDAPAVQELVADENDDDNDAEWRVQGASERPSLATGPENPLNPSPTRAPNAGSRGEAGTTLALPPLRTCPECGTKLSDKAPTCPNCGVPVVPESKVVVHGYTQLFAVNPKVRVFWNGGQVGSVERAGLFAFDVDADGEISFKCNGRKARLRVPARQVTNVTLSWSRISGRLKAQMVDVSTAGH
jgi:hypothetical protein